MKPMESFFAGARFKSVDHVPVAGAITEFYLETITPGLEGKDLLEQQALMVEHAASVFPEIPIIFMAKPVPSLFPTLIARLKDMAGDGPILIEHLRQVEPPDPDTDKNNLKSYENILWMEDRLSDQLKADYGYGRGTIRFEEPFDTLVSAVGSSEWFLKIGMDEEFVRTAMDLFTDVSIAGAKWLAGKLGEPELVILAEDFPGFINRRDYERFVLPYQKMILGTFPNAVKLHHNDSDMTHLLELVAGNGMDVFHFGYDVDVERALEVMGDRVSLMGNISPMNVLARESLEVVREHCIRILEAGRKSRGFIFATGGEVNPDTDPARVNMMVDLAREFGRFE